MTTGALFDGKVAKLLDSLPQLQHVILVDAHDSERGSGQLLDFDEALAAAGEQFDIEPTDPQDMALIHFTSGTTGPPKAAVHVHEAVVAHLATGITALDLHPDDVLWCTADPGWVTGTSYGIIAPLANGVTSIVDGGTFDGERWYRILEAERVTVWYTAPTAVRMLKRSSADVPGRFDLSALRFAASVGEALDPEAVVWGEGALGGPIHDTWWHLDGDRRLGCCMGCCTSFFAELRSSGGFSGPDESVTGWLIGPYDAPTPLGVQNQRHASTAVVSTALARSAQRKG